MKLIRYGITLKRITEDDLELLRGWRNSDHVSRFMEYREYITSEMQKKWFNTINNPDNYYYIIIYKGEKVGVINEKGFDSGRGTTESGLFLASEKYVGTHVPVLASLILLEMSYYFMGGTDSYIRVLRNNSAAISYNTSLGYELCEGQEDVENQLYKLTRETFIDKTYKIRKAAQQVSGGNPNYEIVWEPGDYAIGLAQESEELFKKGPIRFLDRWENDCHIFYYPVDLDNPPFNDVEPYEVSPHKYYEKLKNKISR